MLLKKLDIVLLKKKHTVKIESTGGEAKTSPEYNSGQHPWHNKSSMGRFMAASTTYEQNGARISN